MADQLAPHAVMVASEQGGRATRDFIFAQTITFFNLHRCLQFCFKPRQCDSTIDGKAFGFVNVATKKAIKATKTAQLITAKGGREAAICDAYVYEADDKQYRVEVVDKHHADGRRYVPRCVAGSNGAGAAPADLNATNGKLLVRRFSKRGAGQIKDAPAVLAHIDTTDADIRRMQLNHMQASLRWEEEFRAELASPAAQEANRQIVHQVLLASAKTEEERERMKQRFAEAEQQQRQQQQQQQEGAGTSTAATEGVIAVQGSAAAPAVAAATPAAAASQQAAADAITAAAAPATPIMAATVAAVVPSPAPPAAAGSSSSRRQAPMAAARPVTTSAAAGQPAAAAAHKSAKAAGGNNSILKYFAKQPVQAM